MEISTRLEKTRMKFIKMQNECWCSTIIFSSEEEPRLLNFELLRSKNGLSPSVSNLFQERQIISVERDSLHLKTKPCWLNDSLKVQGQASSSLVKMTVEYRHKILVFLVCSFCILMNSILAFYSLVEISMNSLKYCVLGRAISQLLLQVFFNSTVWILDIEERRPEFEKETGEVEGVDV